MNPSAGSPHEEKRYFGKYRAIVTDDQDPERLGRIKLRVPEVLGQQIVTDWAWPINLPYGGGLDYGEFRVPPVGSGVYAEFESGLVDRPLYAGCRYGHPKGQPSDPPKLTRQDGQTKFSDDDSTKSPKGDDKFTAADCSNQEQPKSAAAPKYPSNQVLKTKNNGIIVEIDDTPGKGRVHIWHGPSKSWVEIDPKGELSIRVADKSYTLVEGDDRHHVKGAQHTFADGNLTHKTGADYHLRIAGKELRVGEGEREHHNLGEEKKVNQAAFTQWTLGAEKKVSQAGFTHWVLGDRKEIVIGNFTQYIIGKMETNVFGFYSRLAATAIEDAAPAIIHRGGAPAGSPPAQPSPPTPPVCS